MALDFPNINPIALSLGPLVIRWYALAYLAGFLGGLFCAKRLAGYTPDARPTKDDVDDVLTWMIVAVIVGGRLGYVLFYNPAFYLSHPVEIFKLWEGGMAFHGGLIGAITALIGFAWRQGIPLFRLTDIIAVVTPIGLFFGRLANFVNGELYGRITTHSWGMVFPTAPDTLPRHPSQLYESFFEGLVLFVILMVLYRVKAIRERAGIVSGVFLLGYAFFRFMIEYVREPDLHLGLLSFGLSMGQLLCIPMGLVGIGIIGYALRQNR